ncbi:hypothetical protein W97_03176 [Coniosporium apollinis CBS 100218]|uniref:Rhomboid-type serine protease n=1 Tax=Coniosporium apollinis (strain CBS 100218) TaxID=1168221 RepID=R7YPX3_CONA1|nr:uncharacterized protein W97_03176 [Coniosporium apollinis CBS 100218]EON63947.1 hypothetical protein W97_03176 [Coniosporium apollinis CBS 100218]
MAANDHYNPHASPYSSPYNRREDAPLPPIPSTSPYPRPHIDTPSTTNVSPVTSPFDDREYPAYPQSSQQGLTADSAYYGAGERRHSRMSDPFTDHNAIQLQSQTLKLDGSPTRYNADPEGSGLHGQPRGDAGAQRQPSRRARKKRKGWLSGRVTWVVYILSTVQVGVFIAELVKQGILTGSPIATKPSFNPMIGPSTPLLINMGARFVPCMRNTPMITDSGGALLPCPNATTSSSLCSLSNLCGNGMPASLDPQPGWDLSHKPEPNQWWRFIVPIFLHAGLIHIGFNLLLQLTLGRDMEKEIGSIRFFLVYFASGIFGFVLGGNYAAEGIASTGASGALFGILALCLLDLLYSWGERKSPVKDLLFILLDIAIAFVLGLLPGLDNFSHIGGFLMGLVLGLCILHSPNALRERIGQDDPPYAAVDAARQDGPEVVKGDTALAAFAKAPVGFFKGRKPLWWAWWLIRAGALVGVLVGFIALLNNFYVYRSRCGWCKYLSCLPVNGWCEIGDLKLQPEAGTGTTPNRRDLFGAGDFMF